MIDPTTMLDTSNNPSDLRISMFLSFFRLHDKYNAGYSGRVIWLNPYLIERDKIQVKPE